MKTSYEEARTRPYPHLVSTGERLASRRSILIANAPILGAPANRSMSFIGPGMLDRNGQPTRAGRKAIIADVVARARRFGSDQCVVWAEDDSTWVGVDGILRHSNRPPIALGTLDPYMYESLPLAMENCRTVALEDGNDPSHLCFSRIDRHRIEICPGEPITLGVFDDPVPDGERDPCEHLLDADGNLAPPPIWRGMPVTGVDGWTIFGPVQPFADGAILRHPSPSEVFKACNDIAGYPIDDVTFDACWNTANSILPNSLDEKCKAA